MAESSRLCFPPSATVLSTENVEDPFDISQSVPLIDSYDPTWLPSQAKLGVTNLNRYPSHCCHKRTILVHLLAFWVHLLEVVQAKKGTCIDMQMAASTHAALTTAQHSTQNVFICDITHSQCTSRQHSECTSYELFKNFYGAILGYRKGVQEPRYPVLCWSWW